MSLRVAVIGDVGGHRTELVRELRRLGAGPTGRLPDDLVVVQVGDLIHRGPDSDGVVRLVNRYLRKQPDQWIQLIGNHEAYYLHEPVFHWVDHVGFAARRTLRKWWREGQIHTAVAVRAADEEFLITHAGVTEQFWRERLHGPRSAVEAARRINVLARDGCQVLYGGGKMLGGGPPNPLVGPIWADRTTELIPGWNDRQLPFSQVHGHTGSHGPSPDPATSYDDAAHHEITELAGGRFIGVDPGHQVHAQRSWRAFEVRAVEPPRLEQPHCHRPTSRAQARPNRRGLPVTVSDDLASLLAACRPFDSLGPEDLATAVAAAAVKDFSPGELVIDAFDTTPEDVYVIVSGEVDLWVDPDRINEAPAETTRIAILPLDLVMPAFASRSGARFLAEHITHARKLVASTPMYTVVADLVEQKPLVVGADQPVTEVARQMTDRDLPYAAVETDDGYGLVTDELLRRRVLVDGMPVDSPAAAMMAHPAATVSLGASSADALITMLDCDVPILLVTNVDGSLAGAVDEGDFVFASTTAGVGIHEQIRHARTIEDLVTRAQRVPSLLAELLERGLAADRVIAVNSAIVDSIVRRAIALVFEEHPDLTTDAFTWLSLGSNGRREAVPSSDLDAAVTFEDEYADDIPRYREVFGTVGEVLTRCGISVDPHRAFPMHQGFSRTDEQWRTAAKSWLSHPRENQGAIMASLLVDARPIFGDPGLPEPARVFADFHRHPATMEMLLYESLARRARLSTMREKLTGRGEGFVDITPDVVARIAEIPEVVAIKEFSGDVRRVFEIKERCDIDVIAGADDVLFEMMIDGAVGWFAGYPNAFPKEAVELYELCATGKWQEARTLYEQLVAVFRWDSRTEFAQAIKLSMDVCGNSYGGPTRPPRTPLTAEQHAQVVADTERALAALGKR